MEDARTPGGHELHSALGGVALPAGIFPGAHPVPPHRKRSRRRPRRATVLTAAAVIVVTAAGIGGMMLARAAAYADRIPGPHAADVVATFTDAIAAGTDAWHDVATPDLVRHYAENTPFTADTAIDVTLTPGERIGYTRGGSVIQDPTLADGARTVVTAVYGVAPDETVTVKVAVDLTRELTVNDRGSIQGASPWQVASLRATHASNTLTPAVVCDSSDQALRDLSTQARVDGVLDVGCTAGDDALSWLPSGADRAAWAAQFPVYGPFDPPGNALGFDAGLALTRVVIDDVPFSLITAQATAQDGTEGWVLVGTVADAR